MLNYTGHLWSFNSNNFLNACELRPVSRINVNKYTFMALFLSSLYSLKETREDMCNQYEAHEVYFYYVSVKYDVIGYMTSSYRDE